jgi:hypothetical protein
MAECQDNPLKPSKKQIEGVGSDDDTPANTSNDQDDIIANKQLRYINAWVSVCVFSENRQKIIKKYVWP